MMLASADGQQSVSKKKSKKLLNVLGKRIYCLQKASWDAGLPVIVLIEGWETIGKNGLIRSLTEPLDPRGFVFHAIREPEPHEKARPWMWRFWLRIPERGQWAIFDQSWYRRVFFEHIHHKISEQELRRALRDITDFERTLSDGGTLLLKFFLHTDKNSFKSKAGMITESGDDGRTTDPKLLSRRYDQLSNLYEDALRHTQQEWAHWVVIPADDKPTARVLFLETVALSLQQRLEIECEPKQVKVETESQGSKRKTSRSRRAHPTRDRPTMAPAGTVPSESEEIPNTTQPTPEVAAVPPFPGTNDPTRIEVEISASNDPGQDPKNEPASVPEGEP
jgi:polyphosphate kinase 2 (PPK2 family)